jgi:RHS repeat-associated protein
MPMPGRCSDPLLEEPVQIGNVGGVMVSMRMADTSSGLPDSYAPHQQVGSVGDWSIWPSNNSSSGHLNWGGTGNGLQVYSHTAAAAQPAGKLGMQLYMPTDIGREYTVWFITDNNNAGSLDAYALGYNDTTGRLTTLGSATVSRSGNYSITFTAVNDSSFLVLAASALDSDESFTINFASMLRMTNILVNTPTAPLAFRNKYRYGYNGQEKVDEVSGPGNHYVFAEREYDPRLPRWGAIDPMFSKYPNISPYAFGNNNPIFFVDNDGADKHSYYTIITDQGKAKIHVVTPNVVKLAIPKSTQNATIFSTRHPHDVVENITLDLRSSTPKDKRYSFKEGLGKILDRDDAWNQNLSRMVSLIPDIGKGKSEPYLNDDWEVTDNHGMMWTSKNGQGYENKKGQIDGIATLDDILGIVGKYGGSGGFDVDALEKIDLMLNFVDAGHEIVDQATGHDKKAEGYNNRKNDTIQCNDGCGGLRVGSEGAIPPPQGKSVSDYPKPGK